MKAMRIRFPACGLVMGVLALTQFSLDGAQYYTNWAAAHFSDIPAQSGPLSDPDQDGETNVIEFAFGTDPRAPGGIAGAVSRYPAARAVKRHVRRGNPGAGRAPARRPD